jgi:hypothetical protein
MQERFGQGPDRKHTEPIRFEALDQSVMSLWIFANQENKAGHTYPTQSSEGRGNKKINRR